MKTPNQKTLAEMYVDGDIQTTDRILLRLLAVQSYRDDFFDEDYPRPTRDELVVVVESYLNRGSRPAMAA